MKKCGLRKAYADGGLLESFNKRKEGWDAASAGTGFNTMPNTPSVAQAMAAVGKTQLALAGKRKTLTPGPAAADVVVLAVVHTPVDHQARFLQTPGFQGSD